MDKIRLRVGTDHMKAAEVADGGPECDEREVEAGADGGKRQVASRVYCLSATAF
jgi:hypothetical protein